MDFNGEDDDEYEPDPVLRALGPVLAGRARTGEIGVFSTIETQNFILDSIAKVAVKTTGEAEALQSLKKIFEESKVTKARAHKLDRLVSERIKLSLPAGTTTTAAATVVAPTARKEDTKPAAASTSNNSTVAVRDETIKPVQANKEQAVMAKKVADKRKFEQQEEEPPNEAQEEEDKDEFELAPLPVPLQYQMVSRLRVIKATVRVRARPNVSADQIGVVTHDMLLLVDAVAQDWLRVDWTDDHEAQIGWVMRFSPDREALFEPIEIAPTAPKPLSRQSSNKSEMNDPKSTVTIPIPQLTQNQQMVTIPAEEFYRLVARVERLETDLSSLRDLLRSA